MNRRQRIQLVRRIATGIVVVLFAGRVHSAPVVPAPLLGTLNGPDYLISIDRSTGNGTRIGPLGIGFGDAMTALEYDAIHHVLYGAVSAQTSGLFTVDPSTGAATRVGEPDALGIQATGMAHDPFNDIMYAAGGDIFFRKNLYEVDRTTGQSHLLGPVAGVSDSL
ncbi:MAG TPA: hypothetical protein VHK01_18700 [Lacipirellulaceae bacterium]|jgi:hypothetical protein|nr:hypothetical protein [Lacipirellulaceae bacterium]